MNACGRAVGARCLHYKASGRGDQARAVGGPQRPTLSGQVQWLRWTRRLHSVSRVTSARVSRVDALTAYRSEHVRPQDGVAIRELCTVCCGGGRCPVRAVHRQWRRSNGDTSLDDAARATSGRARDTGATGARRETAAGPGAASGPLGAELPAGRVQAAGGGARAGAPHAQLRDGAQRRGAARHRRERSNYDVPE